MKIVVLDAFTLLGNDLDFDMLSNFGDVTIYDRTPKELVIKRCQDCDIILANKVILSKEVLQQLPSVKFISLLSTGYNVVDIEYTRQMNIPVCNVPGYSTPSVAQFTISLLLDICTKVGRHNTSVHQGDWTANADFTYRLTPQIELDGKTIGLIGYGEIGRATAKIATALGMKVIAYRRNPSPEKGIEFVSLDELYSRSDIISLHCPLDSSNERLINSDSIAKMKKGVIILNTARGGLIDEQAVANAIKADHILAFGCDVLSSEPPMASNPLLGLERAVITPHIAWSTLEARTRLREITYNNIKGFLSGKIINRVN